MTPESSLPRPHLFIAALGRSGSTMLANLLTTPPNRWVVIEPRFANGSTGLDVISQAVDFGWDIGPDDWTLRDGETSDGRAGRVFGDGLRALDRWGVKEVRPDLLKATFDDLRPEKVVVLVRDIRDAATSLVEKTKRDADTRYGDAWIRDYLTSSPAAILSLVDKLEGTEHKVVRYEDLVMGDAGRNALARWLDWPLDGNPGRHLAELYNRGREIEVHAGKITNRAMGRRTRTEDLYAGQIADWAAEANEEFQHRFGYAD